MQRQAMDDLQEWKGRTRRKPLVIRGARQVGKTTLVRLFAQSSFESLVEVNLEREPQIAGLFASKTPQETLQLLETRLNQDIIPGQSLLFLDEIQATPEILAALRYFYEDLPQLHVIAAGSLLEIVLDAPTFSMPVGRIEYLHLGPMQFDEFLLAAGQEKLVGFLEDYSAVEPIPEAIHLQLMQWLNRFLIVGGMPDAVRAYLESGSFRESEAVKHSILSTLHDDFGKYEGSVSTSRLRKVFEQLPHLIGRKLIFAHIDRNERAKDLAQALRYLTLARVACRVRHTAANGIPLGAEADERRFKVLCLDVGLMASALGLSILDLEAASDVLMVNQGALCEQFVGQHLLYSEASWQEPQLYYWSREKPTSSAEVDYVISQGNQIIPIEVKAGKTGTLKSLHLFVREKKRNFAVRLSGSQPSLLEAETSLSVGTNVPFTLASFPLYLAGRLRSLCTQLAATQDVNRR